MSGAEDNTGEDQGNKPYLKESGKRVKLLKSQRSFIPWLGIKDQTHLQGNNQLCKNSRDGCLFYSLLPSRSDF